MPINADVPGLASTIAEAEILVMTSTERRTVSVSLPSHGSDGLVLLSAALHRGMVIFAHGSGSSHRSALLADRLDEASTWAGNRATAALIAAAVRQAVRAMISRGGRPDLAGNALTEITATTRLIAVSNDPQVSARH